MTDPWGMHEPPAVGDPVAPLPPRLARLAELYARGAAETADPYARGFPRADELPEVQALIRDGWQPLDDAPLYSLLPAAWPPPHRAWVPDRLPRVGDGAWKDESREDDARTAGPPAPPPGRIWLLRSPWPHIAVAVIYDIVWSFVDRDRGSGEVQRVYAVACEVLTWDETRALDACPSEIRDLLDAWAGAGRVGEAAATVIEARLRPAELAAATSRTGLPEQTLLAWLESR